MYSPSRNASSIRKNAPETMSRTSVCEPKPTATPTTPAPASSGRMSTPSAASTDSVAITRDRDQQRDPQQRQQRAQPRRRRVGRLLLLRRKAAIDRRPGDLPHHVREQQHEADAEQRARDVAAQALLRHREQIEVPQVGEPQQSRHDDHDVDRAPQHRLVGRDEPGSDSAPARFDATAAAASARHKRIVDDRQRDQDQQAQDAAAGHAALAGDDLAHAADVDRKNIERWPRPATSRRATGAAFPPPLAPANQSAIAPRTSPDREQRDDGTRY